MGVRAWRLMGVRVERRAKSTYDAVEVNVQRLDDHVDKLEDGQLVLRKSAGG